MQAIVAGSVVLLGSLVGCTGSDGGPAATTTLPLQGSLDLRPADVADLDRCDPIAAGCLAPFPNDYYTVADDQTPTGQRVHLDAESLPANVDGVHIDPAHWNELDGFSPAAAALVRIPDVDLEASEAAPVTDPARSLGRESPVVLLDATTGDRLAHWTELDTRSGPEDVPTLFVRPARILPEGHRIVVAMRSLVTTDGAPVEPTDAFRAYRDRLRSGVPAVEERRPQMERIFADLAEADVDRDDLVVAWDFTVASEESLSSRLLHLRDDAFERLEGKAPPFTVAEVRASDRPGIAREVTGTFDVPLYLTDGGRPGSEFALEGPGGPDGLPASTGTYTATFRCIVPASATAAEPAGIGLYGHGLLGTAEQVGAATEVAVAGNRVFCATDLIGMAEEDVPNAAAIVTELSGFNTLADRLQQGHLNTLVLGRLMRAPDGLGTDPAFQDGGTSILTDDLVYYGISQGGIMGAATTAVAQDWTYAVLGVPAMNYGLLLDRSVDFDDFRALMEPAYPDAADRAVAVQLIQMLWDRGEATGYVQHLTRRPYADTPAHRVLLHVAFGDHQVANVASEVEARSIGARAVRPVLADGRSSDRRPFWGIKGIAAYPYAGSAVVMWDSGAEPPPEVNQPPRAGDDPHGDPRADPDAIRQIVRFLATGEVVDVCGGRPCTAEPQG
ncbi:MAG: hypothetical protein R2746_12075 [Acidimicrobiales bacterium]